MSSARSRLASISRHLQSPDLSQSKPPNNRAELSPTYFLPKAAAIEPDVGFHLPLAASAVFPQEFTPKTG